MAIRRLTVDQLKRYFDDYSREGDSSRVQIDVRGLSLGVQTLVEWKPLIGISYDEDARILDVAAEGLNHRISDPRDIYVSRENGLAAIEVSAPDGTTHVIRLEKLNDPSHKDDR